MITAQIENLTHLRPSCRASVQAALSGLAACADLDQAARLLRESFPVWFVYRGGLHVALHLASGSTRRILLVRDGGPV